MKTNKRKKYYPKWAKYKARDSDGVLHLYNHKPIKYYSGNYSYWWFDKKLNPNDIKHMETAKDLSGRDWTTKWETTLRKIKD